MNAPVRPPEEEWDPEYTPKSRKYYLVSGRGNTDGYVIATIKDFSTLSTHLVTSSVTR